MNADADHQESQEESCFAAGLTVDHELDTGRAQKDKSKTKTATAPFLRKFRNPTDCSEVGTMKRVSVPPPERSALFCPGVASERSARLC